jgi:hypothetical protein
VSNCDEEDVSQEDVKTGQKKMSSQERGKGICEEAKDLEYRMTES